MSDVSLDMGRIHHGCAARSCYLKKYIRPLADSAADFKARFRISLADAFAAALAKEKKAELVTGDLEFKPLESEIRINWLK